MEFNSEKFEKRRKLFDSLDPHEIFEAYSSSNCDCEREFLEDNYHCHLISSLEESPSDERFGRYDYAASYAVTEKFHQRVKRSFHRF